MRIVIIDDDKLVALSLKTILESTGKVEILAIGNSGEEAIELYREYRPEVMLMDIRMNGMSGLEAGEKILSTDSEAKILYLTTFSDDEYIVRAINLGAKGYILKQDYEGIAPALEAVVRGQSVFGKKVIDRIPVLLGTGKDFDYARYGLSEKEAELIELIAQGMNNKEISAEIYLSEGTVRNYISELLEKLELRDRTQLAVYYILTEVERKENTIMWLIIFGLMILAMCAGVFYLVNRFYKIPITEKLSGGRKPVRILIAVIPLAVIVGGCWLAWGMTNAIVVSLHICAVWLIADLISFIVRKIRKKDGNYTVRAVSVLAFSTVYLGVGWYLAHHVWRTQYNVETDKAVGELRIVQISDSHVGATFHADGFAEQIERINAENPDIVVVTGDFVDDGTSLADMEESSKALGDLKTKYGVYFVFGNHDKGYYGDERRGYSTADLVANLEANNVTVLEDENVLIDDRFYLIGRQDASEESREEMSELFKKIDNSKYTIVLDHQPNDYDAEEAVGADMVLSGHTHGGQLIPITYVGEWTGVNDATYGIEKRGETTFITSSGISDWEIKFKTGCKSEYSVIDISGT